MLHHPAHFTIMYRLREPSLKVQPVYSSEIWLIFTFFQVIRTLKVLRSHHPLGHPQLRVACNLLRRGVQDRSLVHPVLPRFHPHPHLRTFIPCPSLRQCSMLMTQVLARNIPAETRECYFVTSRTIRLRYIVRNRRLPMPPLEMATTNTYPNGHPAVLTAQAPPHTGVSHHRLASYGSALLDSRPGSRSNGNSGPLGTPDNAASPPPPPPHVFFPQPDVGDHTWRPSTGESDFNGRLLNRPSAAQGAITLGHDITYEAERFYRNPSSLDDAYFGRGESRGSPRTFQQPASNGSATPSAVYANGDCKFGHQLATRTYLISDLHEQTCNPIQI